MSTELWTQKYFPKSYEEFVGNSELVKDLIADYSVSQDGTIYAFTLRKDVLWHDDVPLTSEDIVFTFNAIKNTEYRILNTVA